MKRLVVRIVSSGLKGEAIRVRFPAPPVLPDPSKRPKDRAKQVGYLIGMVVGAVLAILALKRFFPGHPMARLVGRKPNRNAGPRFRGPQETE